MTDMLLTIAIPTYNAGENLIRAIRSCKNIRLPKDRYEIIVVDNCSTDNSVTMLEYIKNEFSNLLIYRNEQNLGRVQNWNRCIDLASGKYIIFLFTNDEIVENNYIDKKIEVAEKTSAGIMICPYFYGDVLIDLFTLYSDLMKPIHYEYTLLENPIEVITDYINHFYYPFAPIQKSIYNLDLIKSIGLKFKPEVSEINCDQLFNIELILKLKEYKYNVVLYRKPHLKWNISGKRFHSSISFKEVIRDDIKLLSMLSDYHFLKVDKTRTSFYILNRIVRGRGFKNATIPKRIQSLKLWLDYVKKEKKSLLAYKYTSYTMNALIKRLIRILTKKLVVDL